MQYAQTLIKALQLLAASDGNRTVAEARAPSPAVASVLKNLGTGTGDISGDLRQGYREILGLAKRRSLISKIDAVAGFRKVPFELPVLEQASGTAMGFIGEGDPIPAADLDLTARKLPRRKLAGILPCTKELASTMPAESALSRELIRALSEGESTGFFNTAAGSADAPAGILAGVIPGTGSTSPEDDISNLLGRFTGNLDEAVILSSPRNGVKLAASFDGTGARGGELAGVGHVTHAAIPDSEIAIIEPGRIMYSDEGLEIDLSYQAAISTLDSNGDPADVVSLFQENLLAWRLIRYINWRAAADSVSFLNSVDW